MKSRFNPTKTKKEVRNIVPSGFKDEKINFNFRFLQEKKGKFEYSNRNKNYFCKVIEKIRDVSSYTRREIDKDINLKKQLHYHQIDLSAFAKKSKYEEDFFDDAWQFSITVKKHGRVHGFYRGNIFHIVWLDPDHKLYP